jgi:phage gp46-like protein
MSESAQYFLPAPSPGSSGLARGVRTIAPRRYVDPKTRDYVVEGGALKQDDGFTSKVVLALATKLGSAHAFPTFGSRIHEVKRADEQGRKLAERHAMRALAHLTSEIRELSVTAALSKDRPGAIDIEVSGTKGLAVVRASYTAVLR